MSTLPTPFPELREEIEPDFTVSRDSFRAFPGATPEDLALAREAFTKIKAEWATLDLRQEWADAAFMRKHLAAAGIRAPIKTEPATIGRIRTVLYRVGIRGEDIRKGVGCHLGVWLNHNQRLPLWAALALILEAIGLWTISDSDSEGEGGRDDE